MKELPAFDSVYFNMRKTMQTHSKHNIHIL